MARNAIESEFWTFKMANQSEMARNAIQSDFQTYKMAAKKKILCRSEMARIAIESLNFRNPKWPIDLKWPEMRSKVNFGHPKMADVSHFVKNYFKKKFKLHIDLKWPEMRSKVIFGHPKWPPAAILSKIKKKSCVSM